MKVQVIVSLHVHDFDKWHLVFTEHGDVRRAHGALGHRVYRALDDPRSVVVANDFETEAGARAFLADPSLRDAMDRAGVDRPPVITLCDTSEVVAY